METGKETGQAEAVPGAGMQAGRMVATPCGAACETCLRRLVCPVAGLASARVSGGA